MDIDTLDKTRTTVEVIQKYQMFRHVNLTLTGEMRGEDYHSQTGPYFDCTRNIFMLQLIWQQQKKVLKE